jgi:hypothetical protein
MHIPLKVLALFTELARIEDLDRHTTADKLKRLFYPAKEHILQMACFLT